MARDDHDGRIAIRFPHLLQRFQSVYSRQPHIEQHATKRPLGKGLQTGFAGFNRLGDEAFVAQDGAERFANAAFIVDDEN